MVIDYSLAKGLRRDISRRQGKALENFNSEGDHSEFRKIKSWRGFCNYQVRKTLKSFGSDHVHVCKNDKKTLLILIVYSDPMVSFPLCQDFSKNELKGKEPDPIKRSIEECVSILMTPHFVERYIQARAGLGCGLAALVWRMWLALSGFVLLHWDDGEVIPLWKVVGKFAFATESALILGDMQQYQDAYCRTIILSDRLEEKYLSIWSRARATKTGLVFEQGDASMRTFFEDMTS